VEKAGPVAAHLLGLQVHEVDGNQLALRMSQNTHYNLHPFRCSLDMKGKTGMGKMGKVPSFEAGTYMSHYRMDRQSLGAVARMTPMVGAAGCGHSSCCNGFSGSIGGLVQAQFHPLRQSGSVNVNHALNQSLRTGYVTRLSLTGHELACWLRQWRLVPVWEPEGRGRLFSAQGE
jgi:hypothetical protein